MTQRRSRPIVQLTQEPPVLLRRKLAKAIGINEQLILDHIWATAQSHGGALTQSHAGRLFVCCPLAKFMQFLDVKRSEAYRIRDALVRMGILVRARLGVGRNAEWWFAVDTEALQRRCPLYKVAPSLRPPADGQEQAGKVSPGGDENCPQLGTDREAQTSPIRDENCPQLGNRLIRNRGPILEVPIDRSIDAVGDVGAGEGGKAVDAVAALAELGADDPHAIVSRHSPDRVLVAVENAHALARAGYRISDLKGFVVGSLKAEQLAPLTLEQIEQRLAWQERKDRSAKGRADHGSRLEAARSML